MISYCTQERKMYGIIVKVNQVAGLVLAIQNTRRVAYLSPVVPYSFLGDGVFLSLRAFPFLLCDNGDSCSHD